jgi:murein DD-endopeptidase MepM/ murein hydrolase activator NlpD
VRKIRSDVTPGYPSVDAAALDTEAFAAEQFDGDAPRLAPALDTGIEVQTRSGRLAANTQRRQRVATISAIVVGIVLITAAIGWRWTSDRAAASTPLIAAETSATANPVGAAAAAGMIVPASNPATKAAAATPIFASYGKVKLHLPVPMKRLTEIGFHQAAYPYALHLKTPMKNANLTLAAKNKSTGRVRASQPSGPNAVMTGLVIRMWRNRPGRPDTAADVGAKEGTTVLSPVTGTIVRIKPYLLYGKYPDFEMHIHPDGTKGVDVVMIHLTKLSSRVGDHVDAGITPVAKVRKLSDKFFDQLAEFTKSPGDHVHIQINDANYPGYKGLWGAIDPDAPAASTVTSGSAEASGASDYSTGD